MRRALLGLAVTALTVLGLAGSASAAPTQTTVNHLSGRCADAFWFTQTAASTTDTSVDVCHSTLGLALDGEQFSENFANGHLTGFTDTAFSATSGFSFAMQQSLASASLSGSGVPATTCAFDASGNPLGCTGTTIDVNVSWTGQGPITRGITNLHTKTDGFSETSHINGTSRDAVATGTIGGLTLTAADLQNAELAIAKTGLITRCAGTGC